MNENYHIAQINLAKAKGPIGSIVMQGFVDRLDEINSVARNASGFVWMSQGELEEATKSEAMANSDVIFTMSVWKSIESLKHFVYKSIHVELMSERKTWFEPSSSVNQALWWVPVGYIPSIEEGLAKLGALARSGPCADVFTFARPFVH
jgi:hypothetical protein